MWNQVAKASIKACIPFKRQLRSAIRTFRPYASADPDNDYLALRQGLEIIRRARNAGCPLNRVLEIGTGWIPTIPYLLHAVGAGQVVMTDVEELLDDRTHRIAATFIAANVDRIARFLHMPTETLMANLQRPFNSLYLHPFDKKHVQPASVDLVYSRTVLEHIKPPLLGQILRDGRDYLRPGGLSIHFIDNSDHYQHRDSRLSRLNYLRYADWVWQISQWEGQAYQNRLRHSDYVKLFRDAGYDVLQAEGTADAGCMGDLLSMDIASRFKKYEVEDLATLTTLVVARNH
jgi:hypothetical protein